MGQHQLNIVDQLAAISKHGIVEDGVGQQSEADDRWINLEARAIVMRYGIAVIDDSHVTPSTCSVGGR